MLNITKRRAPACLDVLKATPGASWSSVHGDQKAELRRAALAEQSGVCAYCNRKIVDLDREEKPAARSNTGPRVATAAIPSSGPI